MKNWAYLLIVTGASLWGMISIFVQSLYQAGFTPLQIVAIRVVVAAVIFTAYVAMTNPSLLKIKWTDLKYFIGTGLCSIVFFNWCYFTAIQETSVSIAAILLYTAPAFVTLLSRIIFKEWITGRKLFTLFITLLGCSFVVGLLPAMDQSVSLYGVIVGLGSGLGYALYTIFGKFALEKYHVLTVTTYTFLVSSLGILPFSGLWQNPALWMKTEVVTYSIGLGLFPTVLAYFFYTKGLTQVESSSASITATIEPIVATIVGTVVFQEVLSLWQMIGIALVILAVVLVQEPKPKSQPEQEIDVNVKEKMRKI